MQLLLWTLRKTKSRTSKSSRLGLLIRIKQLVISLARKGSLKMLQNIYFKPWVCCAIFKFKFLVYSYILGGNISNPSCGEGGTNSSSRSVKSSLNTYKTLLNCTNTIKEACTIETKTINSTIEAKLDSCASIFNKSKFASNGRLDLQ